MVVPQSFERAGGSELAATAAFLAGAVIAIEVTRIAGDVSLVWPANALAAALLVRSGRVLRLRTAFGLWCAGMLANVTAGADAPLTAAALAMANVFEVWLTTWLLRDLWRRDSTVVDLALGGRILLVAVVGAPAVATVPGAWLVHVSFGVPLFTAGAAWWQSSVCGAALAAPVVYLYSRDELRALWAADRRRENVALAAGTAVATLLAIRFVDHSFIVIAAPLVIAALRMGALGAAILCVLSGAEMVGFWALGLGPNLSGLPLLPMVLLLLVPVTVGIAVNDRRRAIHAREASQRWMQQLVEQSPIGMCILRLDGTWELTNTALQKMLGYSAADLHGSQNLQLFVSEEYAAGKARASRLLQGDRKAYTVERRFRARDGRWIWTRCTTTLMRDAAGAPARFIVQIENLAEQRRVEHELAVERERLATTLSAIAEAVFVTSPSGHLTYMNQAAGRLLNTSLDTMRGKLLEQILAVTAVEDDQPQDGIVSLCSKSGKPVRRASPGVLHLADGSALYVQESATPLVDPDGQLAGIVVVLRDVRSEFEREQKLRRDAEQDALTGLANRRALEARLAEVIERCSMAGSVATLLVIDLDHFKRINDQAGHPAGDEMLRRVAGALRRSTRSSDLIARLGGDEFAVLLDDCAEPRARQIAEDILRNILAVRLAWNDVEYSVGASIGGASIGGHPFAADEETSQRWIADADGACYAAKATGRAQIHFAHAA